MTNATTTAGPSTAAPLERTDAASIRTYAEALRVFFSRRGPRLMAKHAALAWAGRLLLGPPSLTELPVLAGVVAWWPLQEWLAHRYLLHFRPRRLWGRTFDPIVARRHRAHHRDPRDVDLALLPVQVVEAGIPANLAVWAVLGLGSPRRAATGAATYATMALLYEWTHFLVHTGIEPRSPFYRRLRRNHRMHHYRNEDYWLAFTWPDVDRWLGTEPDPASVPRSPTAMNLHGLSE